MLGVFWENILYRKFVENKRNTLAISMFYGIIIYMFFLAIKYTICRQIHARFQDNEAIAEIPEGNIIEGRLPVNKMKLVQAWIEIHKDELMANWQLATNGEMVFKIEGLK